MCSLQYIIISATSSRVIINLVLGTKILSQEVTENTWLTGGLHSNDDSGNTQNKDYSSLNPYSTGSNSNAKWQDDWNHSAVLILILLEVTQIEGGGERLIKLVLS